MLEPMAESVEVEYDQERWSLLQSLRAEALDLMQPLLQRHIRSLAYGSIARGDVNPESDIDVFIPKPPSPEILEVLIEGHGLPITHREIVQATPTYAAKGYIYTQEKRGYSLPLVPLRAHEREFYTFAGTVDNQQIEAQTRVPGVDKRLMLIQPTPKGHSETLVPGREGETAKTLGVGVTIVLDRVRTLQRRERVGRTGVYVKHTLAPEESFSKAYNRLARRRPALRRRLRP